MNAERPLGDVFFDLDQSDIRADARTVLQTNADWMKRWTSTQVTLEGHADSRGSSEYNLALGTRRANSVRDYLVSLGVPTARITVVSKGKEAPFCTEENEACWQQNRRGHFVITSEVAQQGRKGRRAGRAGTQRSCLSRPTRLSRPQHPRQFLFRHPILRGLPSVHQQDRNFQPVARLELGIVRDVDLFDSGRRVQSRTRSTTSFMSVQRWQPGRE